ncbi:hypothetical protein MFFC18_02640 [Mariniblastus fucicola]|uniref:Uncharacterized protein n=1 Tax=Mariniblastus fucicola TaxID=980251 RepID=A0A5B9P747_9BACT|nr:hypothetical protein MFFC18_02640 [Mariniblastus fucicola]
MKLQQIDDPMKTWHTNSGQNDTPELSGIPVAKRAEVEF